MFRIKIERICSQGDSLYPKYEEIYTQLTDKIDFIAIINAVNKIDTL